MATTTGQNRWRRKMRYVKKQLNVMVPVLVHRDLEELAETAGLRGKGEGVSFASFLAKGLTQYAAHDAEANRLLTLFRASYFEQREMVG